MLRYHVAKYRLVVIGEPALGTRMILQHGRRGTIVVTGSRREPIWLCGRCAAKLAVGVARRQLMDAVLVCLNCGSYNDTSAASVAPALLPSP
jgi:hypothetical protein